ncbi:hypothetical protein [Rhodohalobacter sp. 8-1]|uniref:hypothetical protein n=1 Tax=Rhodohalobacter sp. 8-1 TaxID=3131972 RepID=UPI0030ED753E
MSKELPDLHRQAFKFKNSKKFQHDGGRAWIKDSQLYEARKGANGKLQTKDDKSANESPDPADTQDPSDKVKPI